MWPRHLNLPTEAILAGRHDCHIVDSGAWRQPGGETAGVCLGLLSSEGDSRLTDLHKTLASADTTATTVELGLIETQKTSVPVPAVNTASARTVVFIDTLNAVPKTPTTRSRVGVFGEKQRRRLGNRAAGALEGQFLHDFAVHLGVDGVVIPGGADSVSMSM